MDEDYLTIVRKSLYKNLEKHSQFSNHVDASIMKHTSQLPNVTHAMQITGSEILDLQTMSCTGKNNLSGKRTLCTLQNIKCKIKKKENKNNIPKKLCKRTVQAEKKAFDPIQEDDSKHEQYTTHAQELYQQLDVIDIFNFADFCNDYDKSTNEMQFGRVCNNKLPFDINSKMDEEVEKSILTKLKINGIHKSKQKKIYMKNNKVTNVAVESIESDYLNDTTLEEQITNHIEEVSVEKKDDSLLSTPDRNRGVQSYNISDNMILIVLEPSSSVYFYGLMSIQVLHGCLEVFGSTLTKHSQCVNCYSPRGSGLLYLRNQSSDNLSEHNIDFHGISVNRNCTVIECRKLEDVKLKFVEMCISQQIFPENLNDSVRVTFQPTETLPRIKINKNWNSLIDHINLNTRLMITGGKNVGKSTFLRYCVNKLLLKYKKVRIIDLDPGQPEFTVPGCISVVTVSEDEPLLGPNYTHLRAADMSFPCDINVANDISRYLKSVEVLATGCKDLEIMPTLINYMGFIQGLGLDILSACMTHLMPNLVVQICSEQSTKSSKELLYVENMKKHCEFVDENLFDVQYELIVLDSMADNKDGWILEPRQMREMCIMAYFGKLINNSSKSLLSATNLPMFSISFSDLKVIDMKGNSLSPLVVNAGLVALCSDIRENLNAPHILKCHGWGLVRGIDLESQTLVLITPEDPRTLESVFYLVIGSVSVPPSIVMTVDEISGSIPYVSQGRLIAFGQLTKRSYIPKK